MEQSMIFTRWYENIWFDASTISQKDYEFQ